MTDLNTVKETDKPRRRRPKRRPKYPNGNAGWFPPGNKRG